MLSLSLLEPAAPSQHPGSSVRLGFSQLSQSLSVCSFRGILALQFDTYQPLPTRRDRRILPQIV
jgi:hypothetical protein